MEMILGKTNMEIRYRIAHTAHITGKTRGCKDGKMVNVLLTIIVLELLAIFSKLDERTGGKRHEDKGNDVTGSRNVAGGRGEDL